VTVRRRQERQDAIRRIVRREHVRTQHDLVEHLKALGYPCTQATVSRDITELDLRKLPEGYYVLSEDLHLQRMVGDLVEQVIATDRFVIVKASIGTAQGVAAALDAAGRDEILGSIAGDDTILAIARSDSDAKVVADYLERFRAGRRT
jgi:transcriptional regulator of arginine metabolism